MRVGVFAGILKPHDVDSQNTPYRGSFNEYPNICFQSEIRARVQLFKTNDDITKGIIKTIKYGIYANIFADKMWVAKATHVFSAKNTRELDIVLTRTVNILTTKEFVK